MLGGGQVAGLLRFQNNDLAEGRNLLGRMAVAISESMNAQNKLGLTLDGKRGENLFAPISLGNAAAGAGNTPDVVMGLQVADPTALHASSYTLSFTATSAGSLTRHSDGKVFSFDDSIPPPPNTMTMAAVFLTQGLVVNPSGPSPNAGDQFMINPLQGAAAELKALQYSPVDLAAANPVNAKMNASNIGTLQLASLKATGIPTLTPPVFGANVTLNFNGTGGFTIAGAASTPVDISTNPPTPIAPLNPGPPPVYGYTSGQAINIDGWEITLQGSPKKDDKVIIGNARDSAEYGDWYKRDTGNAKALMALRDVPMFDNATLADGFASAMAQVGTRTQSAQFAAELSSSIAANLERDRTAVSGVNLDEEAARLIQYQQAYQASAKMIQIAQNIFDTLIQGLGR